MTACIRWREELLDYALGQPAGAALTVHCGCCASCAATLSQMRSRAGQIDERIRHLAAVEPSISLRRRVFAAIATTKSPSSMFARWRIALAGGALAAAMACALYVVGSLPQPSNQSADVESDVAALTHWRSPTDFLLQPLGHSRQALP